MTKLMSISALFRLYYTIFRRNWHYHRITHYYIQNDNWNGFRCRNFPTMLSTEEMKQIMEKAHSIGVHLLF